MKEVTLKLNHRCNLTFHLTLWPNFFTVVLDFHGVCVLCFFTEKSVGAIGTRQPSVYLSNATMPFIANPRTDDVIIDETKGTKNLNIIDQINKMGITLTTRVIFIMSICCLHV